MTPITIQMTAVLREVQKIKDVDPFGYGDTEHDAVKTLKQSYDAIQKSKRWENFYREKWEERKLQTERMMAHYVQQSRRVIECLKFRQRQQRRQKKRFVEAEPERKKHAEDLSRRKKLKKAMLARRENGEDWKSFVQRESLDAGNPPNLLTFVYLEQSILNDVSLDD